MKIEKEPCTYSYQYSEYDSYDIINLLTIDRDSYKKDSYKKRCMLDVVMRCINHTQNMQLSNIKYI